ncbi:hypothetical protein Ae406Ps2_0940c [Pseudonocardia sp. Ae406_Ps2]|nr:hypothetical protein Ae406Ps2_0940c [Pseudonocardia sp. Ae406_Ps2]OLM07265.1 hypothetical protein Ae331Ps2_4975 [Pseudonocardia sp. Ae331_Ps2]OLM22518.1 hypothetical protein Ae706Ps2_0950c [Pseudonocardia sp. Ae706_Ps2]
MRVTTAVTRQWERTDRGPTVHRRHRPFGVRTPRVPGDPAGCPVRPGRRAALTTPAAGPIVISTDDIRGTHPLPRVTW